MQMILTTTDNPWNPFTNWDEWYAYDEDKAHPYCTSGLVALYSSVDANESDMEQDDDTVRAIARVLELFPLGPLGYENDAKGEPILYAIAYEDGTIKKQNEIDWRKLVD